MARDQEGDVFQAVRVRGLGGNELHLKAPAFHAQTLHGLRDGTRQLRRGLGACLAHGLRLLAISGLGLLRGGLKAGQIGRGIQPHELGFPAFERGGQFFGWALVAARQRHPVREPAIEFG